MFKQAKIAPTLSPVSLLGSTGTGAHGIQPEHLGQEAIRAARSNTRQRAAFNATLDRDPTRTRNAEAAAAVSLDLGPVTEDAGFAPAAEGAARRPTGSSSDGTGDLTIAVGHAEGVHSSAAAGGAGKGGAEDDAEDDADAVDVQGEPEGKWGASWMDQVGGWVRWMGG